MKLQNKIFEIFRTQFPDLVDTIEEEVFLYLEEMCFQKEIELESTIDYKDPSFREVLHSIVDQVGYGLSLIGVPKNQIESSLNNEYRYFKTQTQLKTYKDWLYEEFKGKIEILLFAEILQYFVDPNKNIVKKMLGLGLLNKKINDKFKSIHEKHPQLSKFLSWQSELKTKLKKEIFEEEDFKELFEFNDPKDNLRAIYYIFVLSEFFDFDQHINLSPAVTFLMGQVNNWTLESEDLSLIKPMPLYAGLYLTQQNDIDVDGKITKTALKDSLVNLVNLQEDPMFSKPYKANYIIKSMELLKLKLTAKFLDGLVKKTDKSTAETNLKAISTDKLGLICKLYKDLGFVPEISGDERKTMFEIIKAREMNGLYCLSDSDKSICVESIWGAVVLMMENKKLSEINIGGCVDYIIDKINELTQNLEIKNVEMLGKLTLAIDLLREIDHRYDINILRSLEGYIFTDIKHEEKKAPKEMIDGLIKDAEKPKFQITEMDATGETEEIKNVDDIETFFDSDIDEMELPDDIEASAEKDKKEEGSLFDEDLSPVKLDESELAAKRQRSIDEPLTNTSADIIKYFEKFPSLDIEILNNLALNYEPVISAPDIMKQNLESLYKITVIEKLLRLKHQFDAIEIDKLCKTYWHDNGFGETSVPDIQNTYYALYIYHEYDLIDEVDIFAIHDYLLEEIKYFNIYKLISNKYLFLCLRILDQYDIKMMSYEGIKEQLIKHKFLSSEDFNPIKDTFDYIFTLKALDPEVNVDKFKDEFFSDLEFSIGSDGSIDGLITDTAIAMLTIALFDAIEDYSEYWEKMLSFIKYNSGFFNKTIETQQISWGRDKFGAKIELDMCYWGLVALCVSNPVKTESFNPNICPDCGNYFKERPKFCNMCGHKFS
ncbi:MAG: hypothetical protein GF364_19200 [Candidatus Lokiarchaeota archaeon]|nr:hypothetical protein [Candidatus Lokiarchaeota archaeon]